MNMEIIITMLSLHMQAGPGRTEQYKSLQQARSTRRDVA